MTDPYVPPMRWAAEPEKPFVAQQSPKKWNGVLVIIVLVFVVLACIGFYAKKHAFEYCTYDPYSTSHKADCVPVERR